MSDDHYVTLNTGARIPVVGLGTWLAQDEELEKAIETALEIGYRHIDTAYAYNNEHVIGKVINRWISEEKIRREDIFITTKLPICAMRPELLFKYLDESLSRLQVDYVDLYQLHFPLGLTENYEKDEEGNYILDITTDIIAMWKKMEEAVEAGKAKAIGMSNFSAAQLKRILEDCKIPPANLQIELQIYFQQEALVKFCMEHNIRVTSYGSLGSAGSYGLIIHSKTALKLMEEKIIVGIAKKHNKLPSQVLLRYWTQQGIIVIPKSTNPKNIKSNFELFDFELNNKEMAVIKLLDRKERGRLFICNTIFPGAKEHPEYVH